MLNPALGFAAALLVFGNTGGLFQKNTQLFRLGFDQARNHALFDDGVTARAEAGAEEQIGNITPPAARTVEHIFGLPVTGDGAFYRNLIVLGKLATDLAIRFAVVKHQLNRGHANRFA